MKLTLIERKPIFHDVESFIFKSDEPLDWQPGQYLHYVFPHEPEDSRGEERWFTISSPPYERRIVITTRFAPKEGSSFKRALKAMNIGDSLQADGPKGKFTIDQEEKKHILIAGGIGITPYHSQLLQLDHDGKDLNIELLWANRDEQFVFNDELKTIEHNRHNFHIHKFIGRRRIEEADFKPFINQPDTIFYVSGPEPMVENYAEDLKQMGLPDERVKTDFFPGY